MLKERSWYDRELLYGWKRDDVSIGLLLVLPQGVSFFLDEKEKKNVRRR